MGKYIDGSISLCVNTDILEECKNIPWPKVEIIKLADFIKQI